MLTFYFIHVILKVPMGGVTMREVMPGCEDYEYALEMRARFCPHDYFHVGETGNVKDFEYLTHISDMDTYGGCINTHEHPSLCAGVPKGAKLKYKGCHWAYMNFRFETDQGDVSPNDVIGNVFIHTIKKRFIDIHSPSLKATMWEQTFFIDKFGNKWRLINEDGTVDLIELAPEDFCIWDYADKPLIEYENEYDFHRYDLWVRLNGIVKALY